MNLSLSTPARFNWTKVRNLTAILRKGEQALSLSVFATGNRAWSAVALETTVAAARSGIDGVLDNHGHQVLGSNLSLAQAKSACREFAKRWMTKRRTRKCSCKEIEAT